VRTAFPEFGVLVVSDGKDVVEDGMKLFTIQDKSANLGGTTTHAAAIGSNRTRRLWRRSIVLIGGLCLFIVVMVMLGLELWTSAFQARYVVRRRMRF
jgi:hypothetical protein